MEIEDGATCDRPLLVKLTEEELIIRGASMADAELQIEQLKDRRKLLNSEITTQVHTRAALAHVIEEGFESRDVRCAWVGDFPSNQWKLIRQDTGEEVETRTMSGPDRQREMNFDAGDDDHTVETIIDAEGEVHLVEDGDGAPLPPSQQPVRRKRSAPPAAKRKAAAKGGGKKSSSKSGSKSKGKQTRKAA